MKIFKYFLQFIIVLSLFMTFKIIGFRNASSMGSCLAKIFGSLLRSKRIIEKNLKICFKNADQKMIKRISLDMWGNIGRTFSEYVFLNNFQKNHNHLIKLNGTEYLDEIKNNNIGVSIILAIIIISISLLVKDSLYLLLESFVPYPSMPTFN